MENKNEVNQQDLQEVSGGLEEQNAELRTFIRKHDPECRIDNNFDALRWLRTRSGLDIKDASAYYDMYNSYTLADGTKLNHTQLMKMLNELFPE